MKSQRPGRVVTKKERIHADDEEDETFADYEPQEIKDILAYITTLDDK